MLKAVEERKIRAADRARESRVVSKKAAGVRVSIAKTAQETLERDLENQKCIFSQEKFLSEHTSDMQAHAHMMNAEAAKAAMTKAKAALEELEASMAKMKLAARNTSSFAYLPTFQASEAMIEAAEREEALAKRAARATVNSVYVSHVDEAARTVAAGAAQRRARREEVEQAASGAPSPGEVSGFEKAYSIGCRDYVFENYAPLDDDHPPFDNLVMQAFHEAADDAPDGWKLAHPKVQKGLGALPPIYVSADYENDDFVHGPAEIIHKRNVELRLPMYVNAKKVCQVKWSGDYHKRFAIEMGETVECLHVKSVHNDDASHMRADQVRAFFCQYVYGVRKFRNAHCVDADCCQTLYVTRGRDREEDVPWGKDVVAALTFRVLRLCDNTPIFLIELQATDKTMHKKGIGRALLDFMMKDFMPSWSRDDDQAFIVTNAASYGWEGLLGLKKKFRDGVDRGLMSPDVRAAKWMTLIHMYDFAFPLDKACLVWDQQHRQWDWHAELTKEDRESKDSCGLVFLAGNTWGEVKESEGWQKFHERQRVANQE